LTKTLPQLEIRKILKTLPQLEIRKVFNAEMDFSELYKQTGNLNKFSPNGLYIATAVHYRLVIRDADSLQILHLFQAAETISEMAWSNDSELIITVSYKTGIIQIWSLKDEKWAGKIEDGILGFTRVIWAPDSRHLMSFSPLNVYLFLKITLDSLHRMVSFNKRGKCNSCTKILG
jgi:WD40 repeat protein